MATILYIEDFQPQVRLVEYILTVKGGHEVLSAEDGVVGYEMALSHRPDLIITDLGMPRMDGWTLIPKLLRTTLFRRVPILILTAYAGVGDAERWLPFDLPIACKPISSRYFHKEVAWLLDWAASQPPAEPSDDPTTYSFYLSKMPDEVRAARKNLY
ncbi:MAG: response regulator [Ardenticatenales bacterium]|nr:response regulator [Ardenticatenales bacterium]